MILVVKISFDSAALDVFMNATISKTEHVSGSWQSRPPIWRGIETDGELCAGDVIADQLVAGERGRRIERRAITLKAAPRIFGYSRHGPDVRRIASMQPT